MNSLTQTYIENMGTPNPSAMVTINDPVYGSGTYYTGGDLSKVGLPNNVESATLVLTEDVKRQIEAMKAGLLPKEATKHDQGKPDWTLVPFEALEGMVRVLEFGAKKYARNNWAENGGFSYTRLIAASLRHLFAFMRGEDKDPESGLSHIYHAQCCLLFLSHYISNKDKFTKDDRDVR